MAANLHDFGNDGAAIQAAIDFLYANGGGGRLDIPPGRYVTTQTIEVKGGVVLMGESMAACEIACDPDGDLTVLRFGPTCTRGCGMEKLTILGRQTVEPLSVAVNTCTQHTVVVDDNIPVTMRDCNIWGGRSGLFTQGIDGNHDNLFIMGRVAGVWSQGANWWLRCKLDNADQQSGQAFYADIPAASLVAAKGPRENRGVLCDFTGNLVFSLGIQDPGFLGAWLGSVMANPIQDNEATSLQLLGCSLGTGFAVEGAPAGRVILVGNKSFGGNDPVTGATPGQVIGAANDGVS